MRRRKFIESLLAAGSAPAVWAQNAAPDLAIKRVLVMFKCHLDVGFVNTQANVVKRYFEEHFPHAIETAATARREGKDRFVWTTGSWLIYQYLEAADAPARKRMEEALAAGDIA